MGSCFRFGFKKKQSYAFHNTEPYTPVRDEGRYRASVTVQSWMETNDEDRYSPNKLNGLHNGHHSPEPVIIDTPTKNKHYDAIYDTADPPNHTTHVDADRKSVSSHGSHEVKANGYIAEDRASVHSEEEPPEPVVKEVKKKREIPPHDMENPPPFDHKLNDYQKTMLEIQESGEEYHEHHTVVLGGGYDESKGASGHHDDDDDVSSVSSHGSVKLETAGDESTNIERSEYAETHHYEYDDDIKEDHTPIELVYWSTYWHPS